MSMTPEQEIQRNRTHDLAKWLNKMGHADVTVVDWFCTSPEDDASGIIIKKVPLGPLEKSEKLWTDVQKEQSHD